MKLGKVQKLKVKGFDREAAVLTDGRLEVKLSKHESENLKENQEVEAFIYNDKDGFKATLKKPLAQVGEVKQLKIVSKSKFGYFVDIGIDKDIFLPFQEASGRPHEDLEYLFYIYEDKSKRICATMNVKPHLSSKSPYKVNDNVEGIIYGIDRNLGIFVAVDEKYDGLILAREIKGAHRVGERIKVRVARVLKDGKLTLTFREKSYKQMNLDAEMLLDIIKDEGGVLNLGDKSTPEEILDATGLSKKAFKKALGSLYKQKLVTLYPEKVKLND